ncbi:aminotransferase class V-fold PLP-dependent enzyme, partial [Vibrio sp. FNV 38]|nr:aminotransferase class V-fold PLP-dependent enzyme [Vibrio sp. FNV 38]
EMVEGFYREIRAGAQLAVCTHVSNVFGYVLPIERIADLCSENRVPLIIDASQSAGTIPVDWMRLRPAYIAMPGHKALMGPQGTGILICSNTAEPIIEGGTGSNSFSFEMPGELPDRLEAGTHNMPGIAGLNASMEYNL